MLRFTSRLAVLVVSIAAAAQSANAGVVLTVDQQIGLLFVSQPLPAGFDDVADQTMSVVTPFGVPAIVDCAILTGACTQSTGSITSTTSAAIPGTEISVAVTAGAGGDAVSADVRETCTSSCVTNASTQPGVSDFQHLMVSLAGPSAPEFVDVDVTFTLISSFLDNSTVPATSPYSASAISALFVGEASTYTSGPGGSIFTPFAAIVTAGRDVSGNVTANESLVDATQTIRLRPNADYWVGLTARTVTWFFQFGGSGPVGPQDYSGLDLSFSAFADPTFTLNAAWAAANPELAANLTIDRQFNGMPVSVPEPGTALLLVTSLALLLISRARSRDTRRTAAR